MSDELEFSVTMPIAVEAGPGEPMVDPKATVSCTWPGCGWWHRTAAGVGLGSKLRLHAAVHARELADAEQERATLVGEAGGFPEGETHEPIWCDFCGVHHSAGDCGVEVR